MKKALITIGGLVILTAMLYAAVSINVFTDKSFATSEAAVVDTSSTVSVYYYNHLNLLTSVTGTDSVKIKIYVDGQYDGKWDNSILTDSLIIANGSGDYSKSTELRGLTAGIGGYEAIRIRNAITSGAADDSSSALSYSQNIIGR